MRRATSGCLREGAKSYVKCLRVARGPALGHRYSPVKLMCSHPSGERLRRTRRPAGARPTACAPCARATCSSSGSSPASAATSPIWSTPCRTCRPAAWDWGYLAGQGAQIDTTTAAGRLVFGIFAALAEFERELIRERTMAGLKGRAGPWPQGRQEVRAVESTGAAGPGRDGPPRHLRYPTCAANSGSSPWRSTDTSGPRASCASRVRRSSPEYGATGSRHRRPRV